MSVDKSRRKAHFLNVDLEIEAARKLDSLAAEMGERVSVLHSGPGSRAKHHRLSVEIAGPFSLQTSKRTPDRIIHALCDVVEKLSPRARRIWNAAFKEFNVGFELQADERSSEFSLQPDTLQRIARLGADLAVTYYNRGAIEQTPRAA